MKKAICITNIYVDFIEGKEYRVLESTGNYVKILDDFGEAYIYSTSEFQVMENFQDGEVIINENTLSFGVVQNTLARTYLKVLRLGMFSNISRKCFLDHLQTRNEYFEPQNSRYLNEREKRKIFSGIMKKNVELLGQLDVSLIHRYHSLRYEMEMLEKMQKEFAMFKSYLTGLSVNPLKYQI